MDQTNEFANIEEHCTRKDYTGKHSEISFQTLTARRYSRCRQHVQLIAQKNVRSKGPIPATTFQKLFFYQTYTSSLSKTQMVFRERREFNLFIWYYIFNVFCKSLQSAYVYMFLSSFAPDYHFFLHKMVPILHGCNWILIFSAICELFHMSNYTLFCLDYVICGLLYKIPWRRCINETVYRQTGYHTCCNITEFKAKFVNTTVKKVSNVYILSSTNERFNLVQFDYYFDRVLVFWPSSKGIIISSTFLALLWLFNAQFNHIKQVYIWKTLSKAHVLLNIILLLMLCDCVAKYSYPHLNEVEVSDVYLRENLVKLDFNMLAESMTAPPVAHVISAKGTTEACPNRDSAIMIISNAINYIFRAILTFLIRLSCENELHAPLFFVESVDIDQVFNIWLVYFATLEYGDIYVILFLVLCFVTEFCTLIISCQCLLEAIVCEWNWIKPYCVALLIFLTSAFLNYVFNSSLSVVVNWYFKSYSSLVEALTIFWIYPLGRLTDDINFHCGSPLTKLRVLSFKMLPLFYSIKVFLVFKHLKMQEFAYNEIGISRTIFYLIPIIPLVFGALYAVFRYKIIKGTSWTQLIKPVPEWGPKDIHLRNLRKQFDSRNYVASQAPRELSRHLIEKSRVYKLDIDFEGTQRQSHSPTKYFKETKKRT